MRFRLFSAGSGLPNLREPHTYADCYRDANCHRNTDCNCNTEGDPDSEAASEPPASPDTVEQTPRPKNSVKNYMSGQIPTRLKSTTMLFAMTRVAR